MRVGVGYRQALASWIHSHPEQLQCVELTAEHFFDANRENLSSLAEHYPIFVHGLGLSLGTPGELDQAYLSQFSEICDLVNAEWVSEHIAFSRTSEFDLGHLNPVPFTEEMLELMRIHVEQLSDYCQRPVILENITSHLTIPGRMSETEFINRLCDQAGCGFLLDVTNLYVNSQNHGYDPVQWLYNIKPEHIVQLHVVGYSKVEGRYEDLHSESIQQDLWALIDKVLDYASVQAVIIERDSNFPSNDELTRELCLLSACHA